MSDKQIFACISCQFQLLKCPVLIYLIQKIVFLLFNRNLLIFAQLLLENLYNRLNIAPVTPTSKFVTQSTHLQISSNGWSQI